MEFESELRKKYNEEYRLELMKELGLTNGHQVPKLDKIVVNAGVGEAKLNPEIIDQMSADLMLITGQKPIVTLTKKAVSNFKIRENMPIGVKITLRGIRMWFFLEKLIHIVLPRIKDFNGLSDKAFDGHGNYSIGLKEHVVFPEIDTTKVTKARGMQIVIGTTAIDDKQAYALLSKLGLPFVKRKS